MGFKESVQSDLEHVFFNPDEFGELCTLDNHQIICIVDDDILIRKYSSEFDQLPEGSHMVSMMKSEVKKLMDLPKVSDAVVFNHVLYTINEKKEEDGMITLFLASGRM